MYCLRNEIISKCMYVLSTKRNNMQPSTVLRDLGVIVDSGLSLKKHYPQSVVNVLLSTASAAFDSKSLAKQGLIAQLGQEFELNVAPLIDYCNSCAAGLSKSVIAPSHAASSKRPCSPDNQSWTVRPRQLITPSDSCSIGSRFIAMHDLYGFNSSLFE